VSQVATGRSSGLRCVLVVLAEMEIHHCPSIFCKVLPISSAAKFFSRMGFAARSASIRPSRTARARLTGALGGALDGLGFLDVYMVVIWEMVKSIKGIYIIQLPHNTVSSSLFYFLADV
jgi:hypothetical protein